MITTQDIKEQIEWDKLTCPALFDSEWFEYLYNLKIKENEDVDRDGSRIRDSRNCTGYN